MQPTNPKIPLQAEAELAGSIAGVTHEKLIKAFMLVNRKYPKHS